jgi:F-type H+-transporting ATPase subunit gamma
MAKARALVKRRKAIINLRKITRTMNLIATVRYQKNVRRIQSFRPFAQQVRRIVGELLAASPGVDHPLLKVHDPQTNRIALIVLTSDRGLCGAYNGNIIRVAVKFATEQEAAGKQIDLYVLGKKGIVIFARQKWPMVEKYEAPGGQGIPEFPQVRKFAARMMEKYTSGQYDSIHVAVTQFISAGRQQTAVIQMMPVLPEKLSGPKAPAQGGTLYDISPDPQALLDELLPAAINVSMFQALLEAATSEQFIRMISMKSATENAERLIKSLTMRYNRARQSQITTELCEIMGAVEAMK